VAAYSTTNTPLIHNKTCLQNNLQSPVKNWFNCHICHLTGTKHVCNHVIITTRAVRNPNVSQTVHALQKGSTFLVWPVWLLKYKIFGNSSLLIIQQTDTVHDTLTIMHLDNFDYATQQENARKMAGKLCSGSKIKPIQTFRMSWTDSINSEHNTQSEFKK